MMYFGIEGLRRLLGDPYFPGLVRVGYRSCTTMLESHSVG